MNELNALIQETKTCHQRPVPPLNYFLIFCNLDNSEAFWTLHIRGQVLDIAL